MSEHVDAPATAEAAEEARIAAERSARRGRFLHMFDTIHGHTLTASRIMSGWLRESSTYFQLKSNLAFAAEQEVIDLAIKVLGNPKLAIAALRGCRGDLAALEADLIAVRLGVATLEATMKQRADERAIRGSADAAYEAVVDKVIERRGARASRDRGRA